MYMTSVQVAELRNNLSRLLKAVEAGEEIEVLNRDRPVARLVPPRSQPRATIVPAKRPFSEVRDIRYEPIGPPGFDIVEMLLDDRRKR